MTFCDKTVPSDAGFTLDLSQRMNYAQFTKAVAERLGCDPYQLQMFKSQKYVHTFENLSIISVSYVSCHLIIIYFVSYKDSPGPPLRCNFEGTLKDLLVYSKPKGPRKVFYQILSIKVSELENKRPFKVNRLFKHHKFLLVKMCNVFAQCYNVGHLSGTKVYYMPVLAILIMFQNLFQCLWVTPKLKEEEYTLYPNKNGTVADLFEEIRKQVELSPETGSGKLRLVLNFFSYSLFFRTTT